MKKSFLPIIVSLCMAVSVISSCASSPKEPFSLDWSAEKIYDHKKAVQFAENYQMKVMVDDSDDVMSIFYAENDAGDQVLLYERKKIDFIRGEKLSYINAKGNASSVFVIDADAEFSIKNTDSQMTFHKDGYYMPSAMYETFTKMCVQGRDLLELKLKKDYKINFEEEINPAQYN